MNRIVVSLYISKNDLEIADWLNFMKQNHLNTTSWLSGLLAAEQLGKSLPIGILPPLTKDSFQPSAIDENLPESGHKTALDPTGFVFGGATIDEKPTVQKNKWRYGWQVRGEDGSYITGSVVSFTFWRPEIVALLRTFKENHYPLSTHIKKLILQNVYYGNDELLPNPHQLTAILNEYYFKTTQKISQSTSSPL